MLAQNSKFCQYLRYTYFLLHKTNSIDMVYGLWYILRCGAVAQWGERPALPFGGQGLAGFAQELKGSEGKLTGVDSRGWKADLDFQSIVLC